jgi:hypothetical protein
MRVGVSRIEGERPEMHDKLETIATVEDEELVQLVKGVIEIGEVEEATVELRRLSYGVSKIVHLEQ